MMKTPNTKPRKGRSAPRGEHQTQKSNLAMRGVVAGVRMVCGSGGMRYRHSCPAAGGKLAAKWAEKRGETPPVVGGSLAALERKLREI